MGILYKVTDKELAKIRNKIFLESGLPGLQRNGFEESPFSTHWFGWDYNGAYSYELCRISGESLLEFINIDIAKGDSWIKIFLNIFKLEPGLKSLQSMKGSDGLLFGLPPNSRTQMRLRLDDYRGIPLFRLLFLREHKIGPYNSSNGLQRRIKKLRSLIERDVANIDSFVQRWHELHEPFRTSWKGEPLEGDSKLLQKAVKWSRK